MLARMFGDVPPDTALNQAHTVGPRTLTVTPGQVIESPGRLGWRPPRWRDYGAHIDGAATVADVFIWHHDLDRPRWARAPHTIAELRQRIETLSPSLGVHRVTLSVQPALWDLSDLREFAGRMAALIPTEEPGAEDDFLVTLHSSQEIVIDAYRSTFYAVAFFHWSATQVLREFRYRFEDGVLCRVPFFWIDSVLNGTGPKRQGGVR
jgi:hypothetical protein